MNNIWKRSLSLLLALTMILGVLPLGVLAEEVNAEDPSAPVVTETAVTEPEVPEETQAAAPETEAAEPVVVEAVGPVVTAEPVPVSNAVADEDADGIVWLDKSKALDGTSPSNALISAVAGGNLKTWVLDALGRSGSSDKVLYNGLDVGNVFALMNNSDKVSDLGDDVYTSIENHESVPFTVGGKVYYIAFRNILGVEISVSDVTIAEKAAPADLAAAVDAAVKAANITITHAGDDIDLSEAEVTYATKSYTWPQDSKTNTYNNVITVTIKDALAGTPKTGTGRVVLTDTTETFTVTYKSQGATVASYTVVEDSATPKPADPTRTYYTFDGWDPAVAGTVKGDATYTAKWKPIKNDYKPELGLADEEDTYTVTYMNGESVYATYNEVYGTKTPVPTAPTDQEKTFAGWRVEGAEENGVDATVTADVTYVAQWSSTFVVTYLRADGTYYTSLEVITTDNDDKVYAAELLKNYPDTDADGVIYAGWYCVDEYDEYTTKYDFKAVVEGNLTLRMKFLPDRNNNSVEDGTTKDPFTYYVFQDVNGNEITKLDWLNGEDEIDSATVDYPDTDSDGILFLNWNEPTQSGNTYTYTPNTVADTNNNGIADALEGGKVANMDGYAYQAGQLVSTLGTIVIPGLQEDGSFLVNANGFKITAKPAKVSDTVMSYVNKISVNGVKLEWTYGANYTATCVISAETLAAIPAAMDEAAEAKYVLDISEAFVQASIVPKKEHGLELGKTYTAEQVYDAVVETPDMADDAEYSVQYLARAAAGEVDVNVKALRDFIEANATILGSYKDKALNFYYELTGNDDTYTYEVTEIYQDVDTPAEKTLTPQEAADIFIASLTSVNIGSEEDISALVSVILSLEDNLKAALDEANLRSFLSNTQQAKTVTETLKIAYKDKRMDIAPTEVKITLDEPRKPTSISVPEKVTLPYGSFTDADLLKKATLNGVSGTLNLNGQTYAGKNVGTYDVIVKYDGDDSADYMESTARFTLEITKADVEISISRAEVDSGEDYAARVTPKVTPAINVTMLNVIVGLDLSGINVDTGTNNTVGTVQANAWIKAPDSLLMIMEGYGLDISNYKTYTLAELETMLGKMQGDETDATVKTAIDYLLKVLDKIEKFADVKMGITFNKDAYPTQPGIYANLAITMDSNVNTAYGANAILIQPFAALANRNLQLVYSGLTDSQNKFEFDYDGQPKALRAVYDNAYADDCDIYYYGINSGVEVHYSAEAPSKPGYYVAVATYMVPGENGFTKLGSDVAVMTIGVKDGNVEVPSHKVVTYDGNKYGFDITATAGAGLTVITGTAGIDYEGTSLGLQDITGNLNIDFPARLDAAWENYSASQYVPQKPEDIIPADVVSFLEYLETEINKQSKEEKMIRKLLKDNASYIDTVKSYATKTCNKLIELLKLVPQDISVTFENDVKFTDIGVYVCGAVITDPAYLPDADVGVMIIKSDKTYKLLDTHVAYDGNSHTVEVVDETYRDDITMIIDRKGLSGYNVNFLADDNHAQALIKKIENKFGVTISGNKIELGALYDKTGNGAQKLAEAILEVIEEEACARIDSDHLTDEQIEAAIAKVKEALPGLKTRVINKLRELDTLSDDIVIAVNNAEPSKIGEYEYYSCSYALTWDSAKLYIETPITITAVVDPATVTVGESAENVAITYTVKNELTGEEVEETTDLYKALELNYIITKPAEEEDAKPVEVTLTEALATPGTYTITPTYTDVEEYYEIVEPATLVVEEPVVGKITSNCFSLNLKGVVYMEYMVNLEGFSENIDFEKDGGVVIWTGTEKPTSSEQLQIGAENCVTQEGMYWSDIFNTWAVSSLGINAEKYGDEVYMRAYVKIGGNQIVYGSAAYSSPEKYCEQKLNESVDITPMNIKETCAALLEYGTAAQKLFDYKLDALVNAGWDMTPYNLEFSTDMIDALNPPTANKADTLSGIRTDMITKAEATLSLEGAIRIQLGYDISIENIASAEVLFWTEEAYNNASTLAYEANTYSYSVPLTWGTFIDKECYTANSELIAAKECGDTVYFCVRVVTENGDVYRGGLSWYSPDRYVEQKYENEDTEIAAAVKTLAVYSEKARVLFGYK